MSAFNLQRFTPKLARWLPFKHPRSFRRDVSFPQKSNREQLSTAAGKAEPGGTWPTLPPPECTEQTLTAEGRWAPAPGRGGEGVRRAAPGGMPAVLARAGLLCTVCSGLGPQAAERPLEPACRTSPRGAAPAAPCPPPSGRRSALAAAARHSHYPGLCFLPVMLRGPLQGHCHLPTEGL